jgi:polyhydroxyalkanoate synthesis regulator phasin
MQALKMELTKAIEHECKKGTKIMLQRLGATETRLMQNTRHHIEGLRNDLRNLKNEVVPGIRMVSAIFSSILDMP